MSLPGVFFGDIAAVVRLLLILADPPEPPLFMRVLLAAREEPAPVVGVEVAEPV